MNHEFGSHVGCKGMVGLLYQIWLRFIDRLGSVSVRCYGIANVLYLKYTDCTIK